MKRAIKEYSIVLISAILLLVVVSTVKVLVSDKNSNCMETYIKTWKSTGIGYAQVYQMRNGGFHIEHSTSSLVPTLDKLFRPVAYVEGCSFHGSNIIFRTMQTAQCAVTYVLK